jgi:hypothetical protein
MAGRKQTKQSDYNIFNLPDLACLKDFLDKDTVAFLKRRKINFEETVISQMMNVKQDTEFLPIIGPLGMTPTKVSLPRDMCHKLGFWHNAVLVIVMKGNMIGVQTRDPSKEKFGGLKDIGIAGHVDSRTQIPSMAGFAEFAELNITLPPKIQMRHFMPMQGFLDRRLILPGTNKYMIENQFYYTFYIDIAEFPEIQITKDSFVDGEVCEFKWQSIPEILKSVKHAPEEWHPRQQWIYLLDYISKIR